MKCIIAEKPSVARDIARIVGANRREDGYMEGGGYIVTWAMGHLITLAMPEADGCSEYRREDLPIVPKPFELVVRQVRSRKEYKSDPAALKQLKVIRSCFERADSLIVATDAGREGELIFRWIYDHSRSSKPFERLWISSLTDKAIREGMASLRPGRDYDNLYHSAQARAHADWLVGINASRALSIARKGGYSLGRVQTPTLAMICRRFIENRDFKSVTYWKTNAFFSKDGILCKAVSRQDFESEAAANFSADKLREAGSLAVKNIVRKGVQTQPPLLYDLTALQKEANRRHGFSADKTLTVLQSFYEKKITTYPRTGSRYISEDIFEQIPDLLQSMGIILPLPLNGHSVDNAKVTDHHAIIPTGEKAEGLGKDEDVLFQMIVARLRQAFSPASQEEKMQLELSDGQTNYLWKGSRIVSPGWKAVSGQEEDRMRRRMFLCPFLMFGKEIRSPLTSAR